MRADVRARETSEQAPKVAYFSVPFFAGSSAIYFDALSLLVLRTRLRFGSAPLAILLLAIASLFGLTSTSPAFADEALARQHFKKGIDLYDKKQYAEALTEFQEAYKEKPSAGIKQNIALCLKGLGKPAEAATSFDEALDEGKGTLKPETKAAIEHELAELQKVVATLNITTVTEVAVGDRKPVDNATITIEPAEGKPYQLAPNAHRKPIRLMPGLYVIRAKAPSFATDPEPKKFALVSGQPVDTAFVFGTPAGGAPPPGQGILSIEPSVADADVRIDGALVGKGKWRGPVPAGAHKVEVSAPNWKTTTLDVSVTAGATVSYPIKLLAEGEAPPEYTAPGLKPPRKRRAYLAITGGLDLTGYRLSQELNEKLGNSTRRTFVGATVGGRLGLHLHPLIALELDVEAGAQGSKYKVNEKDTVDTSTTIVHWQVMPMLRAMGPGKVRFMMGTGFGPHGIAVEAKLAEPGKTVTKKGQGIAFAWQIDAGAQADIGPVILEGAVFLNVHGIGPVRGNDAPEDRFLEASPGVRGGLRLGLGIPF